MFLRIKAVERTSEVVEPHVLEQAGKQVFLLGGPLLVDIPEVSLVLFGGIHEGFDCIVAGVHAKSYPLMQQGLGLVGGVDVDERQRQHPLVVMVDSRIDHAVSNGLCHNLLCFFHAFKAELLLDVFESNLGVRNVDFLKTELDDSVLESVNQREDLVIFKETRVLLEQLLELFHVTLLHVIHDQEIWIKRFLEVCLIEYLAGRNLAHQESHDNQQLLDLDPEPKGPHFWPFPLTLYQARLSLRVLKLDCLDAAHVVQIARVLVVGDTLRENCLDDEVASLLVQVLLEVAPDDDVHGRRLADLVLLETAVLVRMEHCGPKLNQHFLLFVSD